LSNTVGSSLYGGANTRYILRGIIRTVLKVANIPKVQKKEEENEKREIKMGKRTITQKLAN
jgi:hypothetical protein